MRRIRSSPVNPSEYMQHTLKYTRNSNLIVGLICLQRLRYLVGPYRRQADSPDRLQHPAPPTDITHAGIQVSRRTPCLEQAVGTGGDLSLQVMKSLEQEMM